MLQLNLDMKEKSERHHNNTASTTQTVHVRIDPLWYP